MAILIVDDETDAARALKKLLERRGYSAIETCPTGQGALNLLTKQHFDIVLLDLVLPDIHGLDILKRIRHETPESEYIILTAVDDLDTAVKAIRLGAYDYLVKPVDPHRLMITIEKTFEKISFKVKSDHFHRAHYIPEQFEAFNDFITASEKMKALMTYAAAVAQSNIPILITGESGTGKELFARALHRMSPYGKGPFVAVNMASIPESLFESQLFGHKKGSFTGAGSDFPGFFRMAHTGTLFLDEIGEIPPHLQVKLLRAIEEQTVTPLGDTKSYSIDCRIVSATNQDIDRAVDEGKIRLDLLYRLKTAHIELPPLRERPEDISEIAQYYLKKFSAESAKRIAGFSGDAMVALTTRTYPGNVRQLARMIQTAVLVADGNLIMPEHLGLAGDSDASPYTLPTLKENAALYIKKVLSITGNNKKQAADILGISLRQLQRKIVQMEDGNISTK